MTNDPEQIRQDIEATRSDLSSDVDALNEKVNPKYVVQRGTSRVKGRMTHAKESVMGSTPSSSGVSDATSSAQGAVVQRTQGNPLAAGIIAFGAGWLVSSLLPSTEAEQRAGAQLKERGSGLADTVKQEAGSAAKDVAEQMKGPAKEAAQSVKSTTQDAAQNVRDEAKSS